MSNKYAENDENSNLLPGTTELIEKNAQNKFYDVLFPQISLNRIIVWISFFQIIIYILSCLLSENLTVPNVDVLMFLGATYGPSVKYPSFTYFIIIIFFILIGLKLCAYLLKPKKKTT
ncbi:rhomboid protease ROM3 [Plasmodium yoelii yoelii]|uniref:Rhomboid protease ROM3 n=1 Tax=Plasmodium yoelii yoelii TaxID=73239 RepID=A0AAE9WM17_PLAYO|nr:rhomboid protease ROM3 [Plasmodium yoelii yoelii]